ncbi:3-oxoacid CoA-transferase subunit B [Thermopolyspora sp. NPDC052614]|uniref:3-oxoacid CoA-transferase subunit B n=1 Tax=Thermopolyspora sp. NPDC052614 TaxID=3155682 RepID=UPI0034481114
MSNAAAEVTAAPPSANGSADRLDTPDGGWRREEIAARAAKDIPDGSYVNLGMGIPQLVADHLDPAREIFLHSENGILGMGGAPEDEIDPDLTDAGKRPVTIVPGGSIFDSSDSFAMIRGGHLDLAVLGAMEVSADGDIANWTAPGRTPGVGGAMDLVLGARSVWVLMAHCDRTGNPKLVPACTLPLTGPRVVRRVVTNLGVFVPGEGGFTALELAPGISRETVIRNTGAPVRFADD